MLFVLCCVVSESTHGSRCLISLLDMDVDLKCNNLSCRKILVDKAVVVSFDPFRVQLGVDRASIFNRPPVRTCVAVPLDERLCFSRLPYILRYISSPRARQDLISIQSNVRTSCSHLLSFVLVKLFAGLCGTNHKHIFQPAKPIYQNRELTPAASIRVSCTPLKLVMMWWCA